MTRLVSPLAGLVLPLAEVPDPVFAGGLAGPGLAIDPTGDALHAPCEGEVVAMPGGRHALMLRTPAGAEILMHVGIDTVQMGGEGFDWRVASGQRVAAGDLLLRFDLERILRRASAAVTPVLLSGGNATVARAASGPIEVGDFLVEFSLVTPKSAVAAGAAITERRRVPFEHGLHARPAALLAACLKGIDAEVSVHAHGKSASARSTVGLMSLGVREGEVVELRAVGAAAAEALAALGGLLAPAPPPASQPTRASTARGTISGVIASRGLAAGEAVRLETRGPEVREEGNGIAFERSSLAAAVAALDRHLESLAAKVAKERRSIVLAHRELIADPELRAAAERVLATGKSAGFAWRSALSASSEALVATGDDLLAERAADLRDLEAQVLRVLAGETPDASIALPEHAILLAEELLPSQLISVDAARIAGFATALGGPTSHVAIIAASMGVPALVAAGDAVLGIESGTMLILDAERGILKVAPPADELAATRASLDARVREEAAARLRAHEPALTTDGERIAIYCNAGSALEAAEAVARGAEGCGLLRSEFLFLDRRAPPTEAEQRESYAQIALAMAGRLLTIRTLDAGGDKPIAYLPMPHEANPALGLRGLRTSLWRPELLRTQLRAILGATTVGPCRILLPMVTDIAELRAVRAELAAIVAETGVAAPALGIMIETPASALLADQLVGEADFLSIGSNDLSQYTLAMDRTHAELARSLDALHPSVLRLIAQSCEAGRAAHREVAVCGGLASDLAAVPILVGLGVLELSAVPAVIPRLKALIRNFAMSDARALAREALSAGTAAEVRALAARFARRGEGT
jgi:multiphosphoryl transfer protein